MLKPIGFRQIIFESNLPSNPYVRFWKFSSMLCTEKWAIEWHQALSLQNSGTCHVPRVWVGNLPENGALAHLGPCDTRTAPARNTKWVQSVIGWVRLAGYVVTWRTCNCTCAPRGSFLFQTWPIHVIFGRPPAFYQRQSGPTVGVVTDRCLGPCHHVAHVFTWGPPWRRYFALKWKFRI